MRKTRSVSSYRLETAEKHEKICQNLNEAEMKIYSKKFIFEKYIEKCTDGLLKRYVSDNELWRVFMMRKM